MQWTGWLIRSAYHVMGLLLDGLDRTSDEAVLAAATLKDLAEDLGAEGDELARELLLEVQGLLLARLRTCQLPTTPDLYSVTEAAAVLDRWVSALDDVHTEAARLLWPYLEDVHSVLGRSRVQQLRRTNVVQDQTSQEMREGTIQQLRQLLADVETGTLDLREVSVTRRGTLETVTLQGAARVEPGRTAEGPPAGLHAAVLRRVSAAVAWPVATRARARPRHAGRRAPGRLEQGQHVRAQQAPTPRVRRDLRRRQAQQQRHLLHREHLFSGPAQLPVDRLAQPRGQVGGQVGHARAPSGRVS